MFMLEVWGIVFLTIILLESVCDNVEIVEANIRSVKISSPDVRPSAYSNYTSTHYSRWSTISIKAGTLKRP